MGLTNSTEKDRIENVINKHQKLKNLIKNNNLESNFVVFNIPIKFDYPRQTKSYSEQICSASAEELNNTKSNELIIPSLHMKICGDGTVIKNSLDVDDRKNCGLRTLSWTYNNEKIEMYKHFDFCDGDKDEDKNEDKIPNELIESSKKIDELEEQIKQINLLINEEKNKIFNNQWVKSKLNKIVPDVEDYIKTTDYLFKMP